jgi:predicted dehydrogenase
VLCEKPVALSEGEARQMLDAAEASGRAHAVNFEGRWLPERLAVWDRVRAGFLGQPYLARVNSAADYWHPSRPMQSEWMYRLDAGGGYLAGMGSHDIDFICALFGAPAAVCADVRTAVPVRRLPDGTDLAVDADDTSTVLLRMASGVTAVVSTTAVAGHADSRRLELYGSEGSLTIAGPVQGAPADTVVLAGRPGGPGTVAVPPSGREPRGGAQIPHRRAAGAIRAMALMLEDWLPAFDGKPTPAVPSLRDGWIVQRVVDAARRSSAGVGRVEVG